ncbi:MAG: mevalonate kinase [Chloroflexi bacterium]|nr:mevalonate kinase [Chloroflexota bacterium]
MGITVSAPAKLFLLGEHAVVFDGTCIVTAVNSRLSVSLERSDEALLTINAPDVRLTNYQKPMSAISEQFDKADASSFIRSSVAVFAERCAFDGGLSISTRSEFKREYGIGSSSAVVAATLFGLSQLFGAEFSHEELLHMGFEAIQRVQQLGSGADLAAAIYGGTLYYENRSPRTVVALPVENLPLVVIYSGYKASTVDYVWEVGKLRDRHPEVINPIIEVMLTIVEQGRLAIEEANWQTFGDLMNIQHGLLHALGVDTSSLAHIVLRAREAGAWGAKLSGAGGGDCAIILTDNPHIGTILEDMNDRIAKLDIQPNAEGVRLEI